MQNKAITPEKALSTFHESIPDSVFECWNSLITKHIVNSETTITSEFTLGELSKLISERHQCTFDVAKKNGWLDLEDTFRASGWTVKFDKASYGDNHKSYFIFTFNKTK